MTLDSMTSITNPMTCVLLLYYDYWQYYDNYKIYLQKV